MQEQGISGFSKFQCHGSRSNYLLEATTHNLYQETALSFISGLENARACVILRDPAARTFSSFNYTKRNKSHVASNYTFREYLKALEEGIQLFPSICRDPLSAYVLQNDLRFSQYSYFLEKWFARMSEERFKVIIFDDIVNKPTMVLNDLWRWLELEPKDVGDSINKKKNNTYKVRSPKIHSRIKDVTASIPVPPFLKDMLRSTYYSLQGGQMTESAEDLIALNELRKYFKTETIYVEELLSRKLLAWYPR